MTQKKEIDGISNLHLLLLAILYLIKLPFGVLYEVGKIILNSQKARTK